MIRNTQDQGRPGPTRRPKWLMTAGACSLPFGALIWDPLKPRVGGGKCRWATAPLRSRIASLQALDLHQSFYNWFTAWAKDQFAYIQMKRLRLDRLAISLAQVCREGE